MLCKCFKNTRAATYNRSEQTLLLLLLLSNSQIGAKTKPTMSQFSRACHRLYVFWLHIFLLLSLGICFIFSRAWRRLHVFPRFPRLAPVTRFPALFTGLHSSRAWHPLHVLWGFTPVAFFPRLASVACLPALGRC